VPTFESIGTHISGTSGTASFPVPSGVQVDDILVIPIYLDGASSIAVMATGFAHAAGSPVSVTGGGSHSLAVVWKRADAEDAGTYDFTLSGSTFRAGSAVRYSDAISTGDPWDDTDSAQTSGVNGTASPAVSVTTGGSDRLLIWAATNWASGAWTPPAGFSERMDTGDRVNTLADMVQAATGDSGPISGSCTGNDKRTAWLGALLPPPPEDAQGTNPPRVSASTNRVRTSASSGLRHVSSGGGQ
jgi:hypothetical protein